MLEKYLSLESARIGRVNIYLNDSDISNEIEIIRNERNRKYSEDPFQGIQEVINKSLYNPEGPSYYPILGVFSDLQTITKKDIADFENRHINPNNAILIILGDYNPKAIFKILEHYFGNWKKSTLLSNYNSEIDNSKVLKSVVINNDRKSNLHYINPNLYRGLIVCFDAPNQFSIDHISMITALEILKIRKIISTYTYIVDASNGILSINNYSEPSEIRYSNLFSDLKNVIQTEIVNDEFSEAKNRVIKSLLQGFLTRTKMALVAQLMLNTGEPSFEKVIKWIIDLEKEDVFATINKWIVENKHITLLLMQENDNNYIFSDSLEVKNDQSWLIPNSGIENFQQLKYDENQDFSVGIIPKIDDKHIPIWKFSLTNGVKIFGSTIKKTRKIQGTIFIMLDRHVEPISLSGINFYCAEVLSRPYGMSEKKFKEKLDKLNSLIEIKTLNSWIEIIYTTDRKNVKEFFKLISHTFNKPAINQEYISNIKKSIDYKKMTSKNNFTSNSYKTFREQYFGLRHCYSRDSSGFFKDRKNINSYTLKKYFKKNISPDIVRITITGNINKKETKEALEQFGRWHNKRQIKKIPNIYSATTSGNIICNHIQDAENVHIALYRPAPELHTREFYIMLLANDLLGNTSTNNLLFKNIRIRNGLSYSVGSDFMSDGNFKYFYADASSNIASAQNVLNVLTDTLFSYADKFTEEMFRYTIKDTIITRNAVKLTTKRQHRILNITAEYNLPFHLDKFRTQILKSITYQEVLQTIRDFIKPEYFYTIITGDKNKIIPQLKEQNLRSKII
jgi:zinc protease